MSEFEFSVHTGDLAAGIECWLWSTHSLQAAADSLATPWSPPSHHQGCFETPFSIASLKINEAVYFQGNGTILAAVPIIVGN